MILILPILLLIAMGTIYLSTYASLIQLNVTIDSDDSISDSVMKVISMTIMIVLPSILKLVKNVASHCH